MSFPIDSTIPAAGNNPSNDQPLMLQNNVNIKGYVSVDHVNAGDNQAGIHKQSSYLARATPVTLTNAINLNPSDGIAYVNNATFPGSTFANDLYYYNGPGVNQSSYLLNCIRAYALVTTPNTISNGFNVTLVVKGGVGIYAVSFNQPASGTNYGVLVTAIRPTANNTVIVPTVTVQNPGAIQIQFVGLNLGAGILGLTDPTAFTVAILGV